MDTVQLLAAILDDLTEEVVFVDMEHVVRYMNQAARTHYAQAGDLVGHSIFECHSGSSVARIKEILGQLQSGREQVLYSANSERKVYMRAVRDHRGTMIGYYERRTPP